MNKKSKKINDSKIDIHIHLAGSGCCGSGCYLSPHLRRRYTIRLLQLVHNISSRQIEHELDLLWKDRIVKLVEQSEVDYGVVLGFDGAATPDGSLDSKNTQMVIPPSWVFALCKENSSLLPGPSINPHLANAMDKLEECIDGKAVLIKWLPSAQLIDPMDKKLSFFYRRLAESEIPLLIHCGGEKTFISLDARLSEVKNLRGPLEHGVKVICAHSATKPHLSKEQDQFPLLLELIDQYPNLWMDNSGLCNPSRFHHLPALANDPVVNARTLYGSDYPVPINSFYYLLQMGFSKMREIESLENDISRDIAIKRFFGYNENTLTRANHVLANLDYWIHAL